MGVPSYFRWLSTKYPKLVVDAVEEEAPRTEDGQVCGSVNTALPNPNGVEYDNLYLDMNGIIHPCSHPENKEQPKNDAEIMDAIFKYIDKLFSIVRPRRLLYMAIDGVAPRAKMNQQRSRRFRSAREAKQKREIEEGVQRDLLSLGHITPDQFSQVLEDKPHFDSNCITPGTDFMDLVAKALQYYAVERLSRDPGWRNVQVILSDASVPGEGEHKIMELIRYQRQLPTYNPNTHHVIYGLDADLIMLGLATHEPHFTILREFVSFDGKRASPSTAAPSSDVVPTPGADGSPALNNSVPRQAPFQFLRINVFREYLSADLFVEGLPFKWDLERALDDYVFLCFFVGNDFLPHMPTLEIREGAIDLLVELWKRTLPKLGGFVTEDGEVDFSRAESILTELGDLENEILSRRRHRELRSRQRQLEQAARDRRLESEALLERQERQRSGDLSASTSNEILPHLDVSAELMPTPSAVENKAAAARLKQQLLEPGGPTDTAPQKRDRDVDEMDGLPPSKRIKTTEQPEPALLAAPPNPLAQADYMDTGSANTQTYPTQEQPEAALQGTSQPSLAQADISDGTEYAVAVEANEKPAKRRTIFFEEKDVRVEPLAPPAPDDDDADTVKLGEEGWKERYYFSKFAAKLDVPEDAPFFRRLISAYVHGLQWVLRYYYQGCCSWTWYYPFHYAPFAGELKDLAEIKVEFDKGTPFSPFEQLMGVLPAASDRCLPEPYRWLMSDPTSPIIEFYPVDFEIDLNGKRFEWQGVALLPFIDQDKLLAAIRPVEAKLSSIEKIRNSTGQDLYFIRYDHPAAAAIRDMNELSDGAVSLTQVPLDPSATASFAGSVSPWPFARDKLLLDQPYIPRQYPDDRANDPMSTFPPVPKNKVVAAKYHLPLLPPGTRFRARLHPTVVMPPAELTSWDLSRRRSAQHFGANTPASRILDYALQSGRGGRGGGFADRGGRGGYNDRGRPNQTHDGRSDHRGGYSGRGRGNGGDYHNQRITYGGQTRTYGGDQSHGGRPDRWDSRQGDFSPRYRPEPYAMNRGRRDEHQPSYRSDNSYRDNTYRDNGRHRDYNNRDNYPDRSQYDRPHSRQDRDRHHQYDDRNRGYGNDRQPYPPHAEPRAYAAPSPQFTQEQGYPQSQFISYGIPTAHNMSPTVALSQLPPTIAAALLLAQNSMPAPPHTGPPPSGWHQ